MFKTFQKFTESVSINGKARRRLVLTALSLPIIARGGSRGDNQTSGNFAGREESNLKDRFIDVTDVGTETVDTDHDSGTAQDVLDTATTLNDYAALRAYDGRAARILIGGAIDLSRPPGFAGYFMRRDSDVTGKDNGVTIIVDALGRRWHRDWDGVNMHVVWAEAAFDGRDETVAFQRCANAAGPRVTIHAAAGSAVVSRQIIFQGKIHVRVLGNGCRISCKGTRFESIFKFSSCVGASVSGFTFDLGKDRLPAYKPNDYPNYYAQAVYFLNSKDNSFIDNIVENLYTSAVNFYGCNGGVVERNGFNSPFQTQTQRIEFVVVLTCSGVFRVSKNRFQGHADTSSASAPCALVASGTTGRFYVEENQFDYCGRNNVGTHRLANVDFYGNSDNVFVRHNVIRNSMGAAIRVTNPHGFEISHNSVKGSAASAEAAYMILVASSAQTPTGNIGARDGVISSNFVETPEGRYDYAIGVCATDWGAPAKNIKIFGNIIRGPNISILLQGPMQEFEVRGNASEAENGGISLTHYPAITSNLGNGAVGIFENIRIEENTITKIGKNPRDSGITVNLDQPGYAGSIGRIYVKRNVVRNKDSVNAAVGVKVISAHGKGVFTIEENEVDRFSWGYQVRSTGYLILHRNKCNRSSAGKFLISGNLMIDKIDY